MTRDKVDKDADPSKLIDEAAPPENAVAEGEAAQAEAPEEAPVSDAVEEENAQAPAEENQPAESASPPAESQSAEDIKLQNLENMRKDYVGFSKSQLIEPDEGDKKANSKTLESAMDMEAENTGDLVSNVGALMGDENTASLIGEVIKGSYKALKGIISYINSSKEDDDEASAAKKSKWQAFKDLLSEHKDKLIAIGEAIISKIPILRSILSAFKMVSDIVKFFILNGTRVRMADQRRKFKDKYADKKEGEEQYVEKSSGFMSWAKRKLGFKKTDQTVNKELVEKQYKGGSGTREALNESKNKDMRQYLIDDKLMKLNKQRQVKKGKDAAMNGLSTAINIMNDVAAFASLGASEAGSSVLSFLTADMPTAKLLDTGKGIAEKALGVAELAGSHDNMKEAVEYTGILLEHVGGMTPLEDSEDVKEEFEHVDSDIEATGVDKKELYKNNGKKQVQKKLLIESLAE